MSPRGSNFQAFHSHDTRSTPLALLSIRTRPTRNLSSRTLSRSEERKTQPVLFPSAINWIARLYRKPTRDISWRTKMNDVQHLPVSVQFFFFLIQLCVENYLGKLRGVVAKFVTFSRFLRLSLRGKLFRKIVADVSTVILRKITMYLINNR